MTENDLLPGMSIPLKTLEEYNAAAQKRWDDAHTPRPNGIACPNCGTEMNDDMNTITCSVGYTEVKLPPEVRVRCPKCGLSTTRIQYP